MDNFILIGKIINTFGIKGELKINSDFEFWDRVFKEEMQIYIGVSKQKEVINSHRIHKGYHLTTLKGYFNINEVLKYKGEMVYILRSDLKLNNNEYLISDLIGFEVYDDNNLIGIVIDYEQNLNNVLLKIKGDKTFYIPKVDAYIKEININDKKIITNKGSDLIL